MGVSKASLWLAALLALPLVAGPAAAQSKKVAPGGETSQAAASDLDRVVAMLQHRVVRLGDRGFQRTHQLVSRSAI